MAEDLRTAGQRTPGQYREPAPMGEYRNFYRCADGSARMGCAWRDAATAEAEREMQPGETFIACRNMRFEDVPAYLASLTQPAPAAIDSAEA